MTALLLALAVQGTDPAELLRGLAARMKDVKVIRAQVVQRRKTALLEEPLVSKGVLHWRRDPGRLVILITEPKPTRVQIDRAAYEVHRPDEKRLERVEFAGDEAAGRILQVFDPKPDELGKAFTIRPGRDGEREVVLEPLDEKVRRRLKSLTVSVSASDGSLKRIRTEDGDGDETVFELSGVEADPELPPGLWDLKVPEGTRVLVHRARQ